MIRTPQTLPLLMCCFVAWQTLPAQDLPTKLTLVVLQGEGAANRAGERAALAPSVRVEDQNNRPVSMAAVVFTLPTSGPTGEFDGGVKTATVLSDDKGVATVRGLRLNEVSGTVQVLVNVAYRGLTASAVITEFTVAPNGAVRKKSSSGKWVAILALVGGGAAAGAVVATHKSGSSTTPPGGSPGGGGTGTPGGGTPATIVLTLGSSTVGHP